MKTEIRIIKESIGITLLIKMQENKLSENLVRIQIEYVYNYYLI